MEHSENKKQDGRLKIDHNNYIKWERIACSNEKTEIVGHDKKKKSKTQMAHEILI